VPRVYCAGPLFNAYERDEMAKIACVLKDAGYATFLPQDDGIEFTRLAKEFTRPTVSEANPQPDGLGFTRRVSEDQEAHSMSRDVAHDLLQRAIFALDLYELLENSDAVVANLNGRVPDEGTIVEAAVAWHAGKALVLYKADARAPLDGSDNPMLTGLGGFCLVSKLSDLPGAVGEQLRVSRARRVDETVVKGQQIAEVWRSSRSASTLRQLLITLFASDKEGMR